MKSLLKLKNLYILIALAALAYGGYYFGTQNTETSSSNKTLELTTVAIQKGDLAKKEEYNGTLRQTDSKVLNSPMSGVVTLVPKEGTIINFGEVLFAVDNKPVILVEGATPFYRTLDLNSDSGPDVLQLEEALVFLGYALEDFIPDETFDETTSNMLNALYVDYKIDTKSEITPAEQVAINSKKTEVENIKEIIRQGGTTLTEVNSKKKALDDAIDNSKEENTYYKEKTVLIDQYYREIDILNDMTNPRTMLMTEENRKNEIKSFEDKIEENKILLFMKGNPKFPQCGFSSLACQILDASGANYETVDVLQDQDVREGIKTYSNWPTIPQLYINKEFIGGADILREMYESGELTKVISGS